VIVGDGESADREQRELNRFAVDSGIHARKVSDRTDQEQRDVTQSTLKAV
jgi:hypothetical protein